MHPVLRLLERNLGIIDSQLFPEHRRLEAFFEGVRSRHESELVSVREEPEHDDQDVARHVLEILFHAFELEDEVSEGLLDSPFFQALDEILNFDGTCFLFMENVWDFKEFKDFVGPGTGIGAMRCNGI